MQRDDEAAGKQRPQHSQSVDVQSLRGKDRVTQPQGNEDEKVGGGKKEKKQVQEEEVENKEKMKEEKEENLPAHPVTIADLVTVSHEKFQLFSAPSIMY